MKKKLGFIKNYTFYLIAKIRYYLSSGKQYYLTESDFISFLKKYEKREAKAFWDYSESGQEQQALDRYAWLKKYIGDKKIKSVCEIGPGSGKVLSHFKKDGVQQVIGVDIQTPVELEEGIQYYTNGVTDLDDIPDNSIDFIYSFDCFEHIADFEIGLKNCFSKLKPGGIFYLQIGPTYYSPIGGHYYHILNVPYINVLFNSSVLGKYALKRKKSIAWTNRQPASKYLKEFDKRPSNIQMLNLEYDFMWWNALMIIKYPSVFKSKNVKFNDFFIGAIRAEFKKDNSSTYLRS